MARGLTAALNVNNNRPAPACRRRRKCTGEVKGCLRALFVSLLSPVCLSPVTEREIDWMGMEGVLTDGVMTGTR